ncbi:hypothetical protein D3C78_1951640 [compost metagenome]
MCQVMAQPGNQIGDRPAAVEPLRANACDQKIDPLAGSIEYPDRQRTVLRQRALATHGQKAAFDDVAQLQG